MYKVYIRINNDDGNWNLESMTVPNASAMEEYFPEIQ